MSVLHPTSTELTFEDGKTMKLETPPKFEIKPEYIDLSKAKAKMENIIKDSKGKAIHKTMHEDFIPAFPADPFDEEVSWKPQYSSKKSSFNKDLAFASKYGKQFKAYYPYDSGPFDDPITSYKTDDSSGTEVLLKLVKKACGVRLVAVNKFGTPISNVLEIHDDGTITMYSSIEPSCGFQTCSNGRVKIK